MVPRMRADNLAVLYPSIVNRSRRRNREPKDPERDTCDHQLSNGGNGEDGGNQGKRERAGEQSLFSCCWYSLCQFIAPSKVGSHKERAGQ